VVLANSSDNAVTDNVISGNRVGITLRGDTKGASISGNRVRNNQMAAQGTELADNQVSSNGGQWSGQRVGSIWLAALALLLVLEFVTWVVKPRRGSHR
jgi:parallel beta-helix repeat protein